MGTDYFVRMVCGVPAKRLITEMVTSEFIQDYHMAPNGRKILLFDELGKPIGKDTQFEIYLFNGKEHDSIYTIHKELEEHGLSLNCHTNSGDLWDEDIIGVRVYSNKEMNWMGRRGESPIDGISLATIRIKVQEVYDIFEKIFPGKRRIEDIKIHVVIEIN